MNILFPLFWSTSSRAPGPDSTTWAGGRLRAWGMGSNYSFCIASEQVPEKKLGHRFSLNCRKCWKNSCQRWEFFNPHALDWCRLVLFQHANVKGFAKFGDLKQMIDEKPRPPLLDLATLRNNILQGNCKFFSDLIIHKCSSIFAGNKFCGGKLENSANHLGPSWEATKQKNAFLAFIWLCHCHTIWSQ